MKRSISSTLNLIIGALRETGEMTQFSVKFFRELFRPPYEFKEFLRQCYILGYRSLPLVAITAFIMGLVLTLQSRPTLIKFGAGAMLPSMVALSVVREIGPMVTALICAGRISSSIGAEIGSMKVTEQIDAMEVSGTHPFKYVVVTRILATTLMIPILIIFSDAIAFYGSYVGININDHLSAALFFNKVFNSLRFSDILPSIFKSFLFGFVIGMIGCYKGYNVKKGTEGVGHAANSAVVTASLVIFLIDLLVVQFADALNIT